jgi:hypothetical protein
MATDLLDHDSEPSDDEVNLVPTTAPLKLKTSEDDKKDRDVQKMDESSDDSDDDSSDEESDMEFEDQENEGPPDDIEVPNIQWPCTITIVAKKFSGKTNMLYNIVDPNEWDNIFAITRSKRTGNLDKLVHFKECVLTEMSDRFLEEVIHHNESFPHGKEPKTLFIFDDFKGTKWDPQYSLMMGQLASSGRNANISMIFSAQDPKYVPTDVRRNTEYMVIGNNSEEIIDKMSKSHATANLPKKVLQQKLTDIARKRDYRFVWMDDREAQWRVWQPTKLKD